MVMVMVLHLRYVEKKKNDALKRKLGDFWSAIRKQTHKHTPSVVGPLSALGGNRIQHPSDELGALAVPELKRKRLAPPQ